MYFKTSGRNNTEETVRLALKASLEKEIDYIVVASNTGYTARLLKGSNKKVIVVTHANGFKEPGRNEMDDAVRKELEMSGMKVYTSSHVLSGAERAFSRKFGGINPVEVAAYTLRMLGQGVKVAVEISTMALDGGLIPFGHDIIAIGGTADGADTAVIIRPSHASSMLDTKIKEIICKPCEW